MRRHERPDAEARECDEAAREHEHAGGDEQVPPPIGRAAPVKSRARPVHADHRRRRRDAIWQTDAMPLFDHLGVTVADLDRAFAQWDPVLSALGCVTDGVELEGGIAWGSDGETELILFRALDPGPDAHPDRAPERERHRAGRMGWQHLAFAVDSRAEVDRLHAIALGAGWTSVRAPKVFRRFSDGYYASFVEDDNGIRIEFMHQPPRA